MAIKRDITESDAVFTGEDKAIAGTVYQADGFTPQNIAGWALSWMLKKDARNADEQAKVTKTTGDGITIVNASAGTYSISLTDTNLTLPAGMYYHEVKRTDDGSETVLTFGSFHLRQAVHR